MYTKTDAKNIVTTFTYDDVNHATGKSYSSNAAPTSTYTFGTAVGSCYLKVNDDGLWYLGQSVADPGTGAPVLIAREGDQAVGTPDGAKWEAFRSIALPDGSNGPVFLADLVVPEPGRPNPAKVTASINGC